MKLAVSGTLAKKRNLRPIGEAQIRLMRFLAQSPGMALSRLSELMEHSRVDYTERAVQGLIKRGFIAWEPLPNTALLRYSLTRDGQTRLDAAQT